MFAVFLAQVLALAPHLSGTVVDPQNLPVPGARLALVCGVHREESETDTRGRFAITMAAAPAPCRLLVSHDGFAPHDQPVDDLATDVGRITLKLGAVAQHVTVVAEPASSWSIGSVVLAGDDLRSFAGTTAGLVQLARLMAGGTMEPGVLYVDGMPAAGLPPLGLIASIAVNADPFSAERADGDVSSIEIITKTPARRFAFNVGTDALGFGGQDALDRRARSTSAFQNVGVAGPLPGLPMSFVANASAGGQSRSVPIRAVVPGAVQGPDSAESRSRMWSGSAVVYYGPRDSLRARLSYRESRASDLNVGVGGLVLPEAGSSASLTARDARAGVTALGARLLYEGNIVLNFGDWQSRANSSNAGIMVLGDVVMGGAPVADSLTRHTRWTSNHIIRGRSRMSWSVGVSVSGVSDSDRQAPNPAGLYEFADMEAYASALAGGGTATWFVTRGSGLVRHGYVRVAPFAQKVLLASASVELAAGVRGDYQSGFGTRVSPRVSLAATSRGFNVKAGAGLFVKDMTNAIYMTALKNDGRQNQQIMTLNAALAGGASTGIPVDANLRTGIAAGVVPASEWMTRVSAERPIGSLVPGIEYTWTRARHLLGSERHADGTGWLDLFESSRAAVRHRVHAQIQYAAKGTHLSAQYEWVRARDNTGGPFSFAGGSGNSEAEWARSAGVAVHSFTLAGMTALPARISLNGSYTWRSSAPYDITTGYDAARNGLFVDRGGRARNSGDGPGYSSLDLYAYRRFALPNLRRKTAARPHLNVGLQVQNLFDRRNLLLLGSVVGAANFGKPLAAFPGRSVRVSLSID